MNLFLIHLFGAIGAAISTIVAEFTVLVIQVYYAKEYITFKDKIPLGIKYLAFAGIMCFIMLLIGKNMGISPLTNLVQFIVGISVYAILLIITKDKFTFKFINRAKNMLKKEM